jgi:hypothetical protein
MPAESQYEPLTALLSFLEDMSNTVAIIRRLVENGRAVDLTGLDNRMGLLCAMTLDLPSELGRALRPELIRLLGEVDAVSTVLSPRSHNP